MHGTEKGTGFFSILHLKTENSRFIGDQGINSGFRKISGMVIKGVVGNISAKGKFTEGLVAQVY
jgi:hypothetical protein